jgi:copper chaperone CopZ
MKSDSLQLSASLDEAAAVIAARVLKAVDGVSKISIDTAGASIQVEFNEDATSSRELRTVLQRAGFGVKNAAHEAGMCCGSCGS